MVRLALVLLGADICLLFLQGFFDVDSSIEEASRDLCSLQQQGIFSILADPRRIEDKILMVALGPDLLLGKYGKNGVRLSSTKRIRGLLMHNVMRWLRPDVFQTTDDNNVGGFPAQLQGWYYMVLKCTHEQLVSAV